MSYSMSGDYGDILAMLPNLRALGGGELYLYPASCTGWRMTRERAINFLPLLETCPYLKKVDWLEAGPIGTNLDEWRSHYGNNLSLTDIMANWLQLPHPPREVPWLEVEPVQKARVIFCRSGRYHTDHFPWKKVVGRFGNEAGFVGTQEEFDNFVSHFGPVPWIETPTMLDVAKVLSGAELIVCNQSSPRWVAEGLKKPVYVEQAHPINTHFERNLAWYGQHIPSFEDIAERRKLVTACIITNQLEPLKRTLDSLRGHVDDYVIGVDAKTTDATFGWLTLNGYNPYHFHLTSNGGFGRVRSEAIARAKTPWVFAIDDDETFDFANQLRTLCKEGEADGIDAFWMERKHWLDLEKKQEWHPKAIDGHYRLFRNYVRYSGNVHENIQNIRNGKQTPLTLDHFNMAYKGDENNPETPAGWAKRYELYRELGYHGK